MIKKLDMQYELANNNTAIKINIRSMINTDTELCAAITCDSPIGKAYGFEANKLSLVLQKALLSSAILLVAELDKKLCGFVWIEPLGAFSSAPYLRLIATDKNVRGYGVGSILLAEFEKLTQNIGRDFCLLVSDFNIEAQAFYNKHGYKKAGELPNFARNGITEILMVKSFKKSPPLN